MNRIFELPEIPMSIVAGLALAAIVAIGIVATERLRRWRSSAETDAPNNLANITLTVFTMFYGILLGQLVVSAYENVDNVGDVIGREASALSVLYRTSNQFPEPVQGTLDENLRRYAHEVVDHSFALQAQGVRPMAEGPLINDLYKTLNSFAPQTKTQETLQLESLRRLGDLEDARHARLNDFDVGIPPGLWWIIGLGAATIVLLVCLLEFPLKTHLIFGCLLAFFIGATIFVIASMDNPFSGSSHVDAGPIVDLLDIVEPSR